MDNRHRPHLDPRLVVAVAAGGTVGTAGRAWLGQVVPVSGGWPLATLTANLVGSFLLGLLLESLVRRGVETPRARLVRLTLGTGLIGGFTTYSAFALELDRLMAAGAPVVAAGYAAATLGAGLACCVAGVWLGARLHPLSRGRGGAVATR